MRSDREERIKERAYAIWLAEGRVHGRHQDHWHRAEREIAAEETAGKTAGDAVRRPSRARAAAAGKGGAAAAPRQPATRSRAAVPNKAGAPAAPKRPAMRRSTTKQS